MLRRVHRGFGHPRVDDDDFRAVRVPHDAFPHDRVSDAQIAADQHDDVGFLEVLIRVRRSVEAKRLLVRHDGSRHALPRVAVAVQDAHAEFGKSTEQCHLLRGHLPGAQKRHGLRPVLLLDRFEFLSERTQGEVPLDRLLLPGLILEQRHRRPIRRVQHGKSLPPLRTGHSQVDGIIRRRREADSLPIFEMNVEAAPRRAVPANRSRRRIRLERSRHLSEPEATGLAQQLASQRAGALVEEVADVGCGRSHV